MNQMNGAETLSSGSCVGAEVSQGVSKVSKV
jgi:hypothetical protein